MVRWMKSNKVACLFLTIELICCLIFLWMDVFGEGYALYSSYLKYSAVLLCFLFSLPQKCIALSLGLFFTLISDYFLLFTEQFSAGVAVFLLVQLCYSYFILQRTGGGEGYGKVYRKLCLRYALNFPLSVLAVLALRAAGIIPDLLLCLALFYFCALLHNVVDAFRVSALFACGMLLFLLCDINVGIYNMAAYLPAAAGESFFYYSGIAMWLFYLPAKTLISLSAYMEGKRRYGIETQAKD